ncbi:hypothetical protein X975_06133, partial [Stegodyphus mimosarum]
MCPIPIRNESWIRAGLPFYNTSFAVSSCPAIRTNTIPILVTTATIFASTRITAVSRN